MADDKKPAAEAVKAPVPAMKASKPEGNPALRMMGRTPTQKLRGAI